MTTSTWLPFYTGDYLKNTMHLSTEEHGAYLLLICHYWQHGKIKNDAKLLKNITKISQKKLQNVLAFFDEKNGFFEHNSIEKIKLDAQANQDKMRVRAEKAAAARWQKDDACSIPQAMLKQCPSPSPSPFIDKSINKDFLAFLNQDLYFQFLELRKKKNKPIDEIYQKELQETLLKIYNEGYCPNSALKKALSEQWLSVYKTNDVLPPKMQKPIQERLKEHLNTCQNETIKFRKQIIKKIGASEYLTWFERAKIELVGEFIELKPENKFCYDKINLLGLDKTFNNLKIKKV